MIFALASALAFAFAFALAPASASAPCFFLFSQGVFHGYIMFYQIQSPIITFYHTRFKNGF
jgi:hypothetical protein